MTPIAPIMRMMTWKEADESGLHYRGLLLEHQGKNYILNA
ncbi:hypothetical protein YM18_2507 [Geobacter sulfurreducens]|nr:hypothetical protein YM18_2507 [Geobacter sulfurreducens]